MTARPHDALFKETFSDLASARGELASVLPPAVAALVDWDTLRLEPGSFVDEALKERLTDLLFSVQMQGREARLYLLFEHQSAPDPLMAFRALAYVVRVWDAWRREHRLATRLPPVIPVLLAQVDGGWAAPTDLLSVIDFADESEREVLREWVPQCRVLLDDLAQVTDAVLEARAMPDRAKLTLAALRDVRGTTDVVALIRTWSRWIRSVNETPRGAESLATLLRYTVRAGHGARVQEIVQVVRSIDEKAGDMAKTIAEELIEEGVERGLVRGESRGRAEMLLKMLALRFSLVPPEAAARVRSADVATLDRWAERVLTATSLDDLLSD